MQVTKAQLRRLIKEVLTERRSTLTGGVIGVSLQSDRRRGEYVLVTVRSSGNVAAASSEASAAAHRRFPNKRLGSAQHQDTSRGVSTFYLFVVK